MMKYGEAGGELVHLFFAESFFKKKVYKNAIKFKNPIDKAFAYVIYFVYYGKFGLMHKVTFASKRQFKRICADKSQH